MCLCNTRNLHRYVYSRWCSTTTSFSKHFIFHSFSRVDKCAYLDRPFHTIHQGIYLAFMMQDEEELTQQLHCTHFFKKTRKGKVSAVERFIASTVINFSLSVWQLIQLVKERYLQRNLSLGYIGTNAVLPEDLLRLVNEAPHKHLLILDTNVCINDIDLFEMKCPATALTVVLQVRPGQAQLSAALTTKFLQTVLQEVRHIDVSVYRRLMLLMKDEGRNYIFCPNEIAAEVTSQRLKGETDNDFNDRLIRRGARNYAQIIQERAEADSSFRGCQAFLISNDVENRVGRHLFCQCKVLVLSFNVPAQRRGEKESLSCMSIHSYVRKYLRDYPELLDVLSATDIEPLNAKGSTHQYPTHVPTGDILAGLRSRKYFRCTIRCSGRPSAGSDSWKTCYAVVHKADGSRVSVSIDGERNVNRALDGDVVAVEIIDRLGAQDDGSADGVNDDAGITSGVGEVGASTSEASSFQIEGLAAPENNTKASLEPEERGRVVGIIRRNWRQYAGSLVPLESMKSKINNSLAG